MSKRLTDNITSKYIEAANRLTSKSARRKIVAYVESYDDILFWRQVLGGFEDDTRYFEIMLPSREQHLERGKKAAISSMLSHVGRDMIACVDADYDYILQGATYMSILVNYNPYVFHTYVYAIENYQCYAPGLHEACVMVSLNDHQIFDFEKYLRDYSRAVYPLFVLSVWFYLNPWYNEFTLMDFNKIVSLSTTSYRYVEKSIANMKLRIDAKVARLGKHYPKYYKDKRNLENSLADLGITPDNTYLYIQGHHLSDTVVTPIVSLVCQTLILERTREIKSTSVHQAQEETELACYNDSIEDVKSMLKKNTVYQRSPQFHQLIDDLQKYLDASQEDLDRQMDVMNHKIAEYNGTRDAEKKYYHDR